MSDAITPTNTFDLDLDTLSQDKMRVKIQGNVVEFNPPSLEDLIELAKLGGKMQKFKGGQIDTNDADEMSEVMDALKQGIANVVPELKEYKLNIDQLLAVLTLLTDKAQATDTKELEKRGIKLDDDQKKTA